MMCSYRVPIASVEVHEIRVGELFVIKDLPGFWNLVEVILDQQFVCFRFPYTMLCPYAFAKLPSGISFVAISGIIIIRRKPRTFALWVDKNAPRLVGTHASKVPCIYLTS